MRFVDEIRHGAPRLATSALLVGTVFWGCSSDPTNPDPVTPDPAANRAPVAAAGVDAAASVGYPVMVDGGGSTDPDGDALSYAWTLTTPTGSAAALDDAMSATATFAPDVAGAYVASLVVNDGTVDSSADQLTVTATDNTVTQSIAAAAGGSIDSSDGAMAMEVPAGALAGDTDISVTPLGAGQLPAVIRDLPGEATAYDMQPDGTAFSTPVEVAFEVEDVVTEASGSASMSGAFLLSESGGTIESLTDVVYEQDDADPTRASLVGGLSHFSHVILVNSSMEFRIDAPDDAEVGTPFDVTFTIDITGAGLGDIVAATVGDESLAPVAPVEGFDPDLEGSLAVVTVTNSYACSEVGEGRIRGRMSFDSSDDFGSAVTVQLGKAVNCTAPPVPLETTLIDGLYRVQRLLPVPGSDTEITTGGLIRRVDLATNGVVELSEASGDPPEWVSALSDGNYLEHSTLGQVNWYVPDAGPEDTMFVSWFDQPRHVAMVSENTVALASAFGDLGLMTYTPGGASGSFQDAFRNLESMTNPQQDPATNLQAIWVTPELDGFVGAVTEGNGDSAFNETRAALIDADVQSGQISVTPLPGIIDRVLDPVVRHQLDLECREHVFPTQYLCVFSSGHDGPAFESPNVDVENDGFVSIFLVDTFDESYELVFSAVGNAVVGGGLFPIDFNTTGVIVANQFTGDLDIWHVRNSDVVAAFEVSLDGQCPAPIDLILIADGARGAVACQAASPPNYGLLVIQGVNEQQPPM